MIIFSNYFFFFFLLLLLFSETSILKLVSYDSSHQTSSLPFSVSPVQFTKMSTDNKDSDMISSLYPPPPPYIQFFTDENVKKVSELKKQGKSDDEISELKDLKFLIPPKKPDKPNYRSFGDVWPFEDRFITLKESGVPQLYKGGEKTQDSDEEIFSQERIVELKKLTKSLLLNFLELIGILAKNPNYAFTKIDNIRVILINLHHLLNSYRLHQLRESLILRIEDKVEKDKNTIHEIEQTCESVREKIKLLASTYIPSLEDDSKTNKKGLESSQGNQVNGDGGNDQATDNYENEAVQKLVDSIKKL